MAGEEAEDKKQAEVNESSVDPERTDGSSDGGPGRESDNAADVDKQNDDQEQDEALTAQINQAVETALAEQRDQVLRAHAEVQNMRRRCEADVERAHKFALEKFSTELLPVMDNMERALQAVPDPDAESVKGLCEGIQLTMREFLDVMNKFNIEQINPEGEPFDPQLHEAMTMVENHEVEPNTVVSVVQKGYSLSGRVIRPARVVVSRS